MSSITSTGLSDHERGGARETRYESGTALESTRLVAKRLGVSVRTVQRWVASGILGQPIKVNNHNYHRAGVMPRPDEKKPAA